MWNITNDTEDEELTPDVEEFDTILEDAPKKRTRRKKEDRETEDYVNKDEMWGLLHSYYELLGGDYDWHEQRVKNKEVYPKIPDVLTTIIYDIATKMSRRANFCRYSWIEEMIGDSVLKMVKAVRDGSFKCYTVAEIIEKDDIEQTTKYIDKKGNIQIKNFEDSDTYFIIDGKAYIKFKANPFGYFSRITSHSYLNRIKKEKMIEETKRAYQEETWERLYSNENFRNVRRQKIMDTDDSDASFEE